MPTRTKLDSAFIAQQRQRLLALRSELTAADDAARDETTATGDAGEAREFEDGAQLLDRREVAQARHDVDLRRIADIDRALSKIDAGTYGLSDHSGKSIPKARLETTPEAVLTVEEASRIA